MILCMTDPPMVGALAVCSARALPRAASIVVSQDVFPEIAVELKRLANPVAIALLGAITASRCAAPTGSSRSATTMSRRLEDEGRRARAACA